MLRFEGQRCMSESELSRQRFTMAQMMVDFATYFTQ